MDVSLSQITSALCWVVQQIQVLGLQQQQQQQRQQHQALPSPQGAAVPELLHLGLFQPRSLGTPWPAVGPPQPLQLLAALSPHAPPAAPAARLVLPAEADAAAAAATAAGARPAAAAAAATEELPAETQEFPGSTRVLEQQLDELHSRRVQQPQHDRGQQQQSRHLAPAAQQGSEGQPSSPETGADGTGCSSGRTSTAPPQEGSQRQQQQLGAAEGSSLSDSAASGSSDAAEQVPPCLRLGKPEVGSGQHRACCTIVRCVMAGCQRTLGVYSNDIAVLGDTVEEGDLLPNDDIPEELVAGGRKLVTEQRDLQKLLLVHLAQRRARLGWDRNSSQDEEEEGADPQAQRQQQQQQEEEDVVDLGADDRGQQGSAADGDASGLQEEEEEEEEHAAPARRPRDAAAAAHARQLLPDFDDVAGSPQQQQQQHGTLGSLLQHMQAAGISMGAGAGGLVGNHAAGAGAAAAAGFGSSDPSKLQAMQALVQEDVDRLAAAWAQQELPKLKRLAADLWQSEHDKAADWQQEVAQQQARLDKGVRELVTTHADSAAHYKAHRERYCQAIELLVTMLEGAKFILSVAQLDVPPAAQQGPAAGADADTAAAVQQRHRRQRSASDADAAAAASTCSEEGEGSEGGSDSFLVDSDAEQPDAAAGAGQVAGSGQQSRSPAGAGSSGAAGSRERGSAAAADAEKPAWNLAHTAPGSTEVLVDRRLSARVAQQQHLQQQTQQQQQEQDRQQQELEQQQEQQEQQENDGQQDDDMQQDDDVQQEQEQQRQRSVSPAQPSRQGSETQTGSSRPDEEAEEAHADSDAEPGPTSSMPQQTPAAAAEQSAGSSPFTEQPARGTAAAAAAEQAEEVEEECAADEGPGPTRVADHPGDQACQHQEPEQPPAAAATQQVSPSGDVDTVDLLSDEEDEAPAPAASITYEAPAVKVGDLKDIAAQELQLEAPCELCVAAAGEEAGHWGRPMVVGHMPRVHCWQRCPRLLELDKSRGCARVQTPDGPSKQVQLGDVRPPPPDAPSSLLPVADIRQHWQQQQQLQQQDDTAAAADGAGDMAVPSLAAVPSWLSSGPGLHAVREALQPGTPLEWYREGVWLPVVVLHCSLAYSRQPDALQALLREGFEAARDPQAAATAEPQLEPSMQLPGWQPLTANTRVATVLLLTGGEQAQLKHLHVKDLTGPHCALRRMLHWRPGLSAAAVAGDAAAILSHNDDADEDEGSSGSAATWQLLQAFPLMQLHPVVQTLLQQETDAHLHKAGWAPQGKRFKPADAALLQLDTLSGIGQKLARRPVAAAVPHRLRKALGASGHRSSGRLCAARLPEQLRAQELLEPAGVAGSAGTCSGQAGGSKQLASSAADTTTLASSQQRLRRRKRRAVVLSDSEDGEDGSQPARKRKAPPPRLNSSTPASDAEYRPEVDMEAVQESLEVQERVQQREAARDSKRRSQQAVQADIPADRGTLFDDTSAGPLNPFLPRCWWKPGLPAEQQPLKQHQVKGLRFLWGCLVIEHAPDDNAAAAAAGGSRQQQGAEDSDDDFIVDADEPGSADGGSGAGGCILAHSMGLGKSFQAVAMLWMFFQHIGARGGRALVVVPTNVLKNWSDEFSKWLPGKQDNDYRRSHLNSSGHKILTVLKGTDLRQLVPKWMDQDGSVLIVSFGVFSDAVLGRSRKAGGQQEAEQEEEEEGDEEPEAADEASLGTQALSSIAKALCEGPSIVVADEAHNIKNPKSRIHKAMQLINTRCRLALTGYPLQNNLDEYYCMISWVQDFMPYDTFRDKFINPIKAGQAREATAPERRMMSRRLGVLQDETAAFIQRAGPEILVQELPPKLEVVVNLAPTSQQMELLTRLMDILRGGRNVLRDTELMRKILDTRDHGYRPLKEMVEAAHAGRAVAMEAACGDDTAMVVLPKNAPAAQPLLQLSQEGVELQAPPRKRARKSNGLPPKDAQRLQLPLEMAEALLAAYDDVRQQHHQQQQQQPQPDATAAAAAAAAAGTGSAGEERALLPKEAFVLQLVRECCGPASALKEEEKVVIFSQSLSVLNALSKLLEQHLRYVEGANFLRLDGSTTGEARSQLIKQFNLRSPCKVFLISTRAGSVGINLVSARRLVLYDLLWNPVHNKQAVSRVWRYGQQRRCFIYHLVYAGTFEARVFERVLVKEELFERVVERRSRKAQLSDKDIDLYHVEANPPLNNDSLQQLVPALFTSQGGQGSQQEERVLGSLASQAEVVQQLQVVSLKNHAEQLQEDPTSKLTKDEKMQNALESELEKRRHEAALKAAGKAPRNLSRTQKMRLGRLQKLYGQVFGVQLQQRQRQEKQRQQQQAQEQQRQQQQALELAAQRQAIEVERLQQAQAQVAAQQRAQAQQRQQQQLQQARQLQLQLQQQQLQQARQQQQQQQQQSFEVLQQLQQQRHQRQVQQQQQQHQQRQQQPQLPEPQLLPQLMQQLQQQQRRRQQQQRQQQQPVQRGWEPSQSSFLQQVAAQMQRPLPKPQPPLQQQPMQTQQRGPGRAAAAAAATTAAAIAHMAGAPAAASACQAGAAAAPQSSPLGKRSHGEMASPNTVQRHNGGDASALRAIMEGKLQAQRAAHGTQHPTGANAQRRAAFGALRAAVAAAATGPSSAAPAAAAAVPQQAPPAPHSMLAAGQPSAAAAAVAAAAAAGMAPGLPAGAAAVQQAAAGVDADARQPAGALPDPQLDMKQERQPQRDGVVGTQIQPGGKQKSPAEVIDLCGDD